MVNILPLSSIKNMNHQQVQDELSAYLDNELAPIVCKQVEAHLRSCDECSDMLAAFQENRQRVADTVQPVPSTLKDTVMAKIHTQIQDELSAYLDNELAPAEHQRIEAHLHACNECSEMLSAFQENRQRVANIVQQVPSTLKDTVMAKIHTQIQDELSAYLDNELAPAEHQRIEAHLHACSECSDILAAFRENREQIKRFEHPAPASIHNTVMATIRQQAAETPVETPTRTGWLPDIGRWIPDLGRWFFRPVTAGATGILTLALILGALYFYPNSTQYEETQTLDFYFELHAEQVDNPLKSNVGRPISTALTVDPASTETANDTETFVDLYFENMGN